MCVRLACGRIRAVGLGAIEHKPTRRLMSMVMLTEDLYLLACDDVSGKTLIDSAYLDLGLGGALVLDLVPLERVALVDDHVTVIDSAPTGDRMLDVALSRMAGQTKPRDPSYWVRHLA